MSPPKKPPPSTMSLPILADDGLLTAKLNSSQLPADIVDTLVQTAKKIQKKAVKKLYILVSLPRNKNQISSDKLTILNQNIQHIPSSLISEAALISNEKDLQPFWTPLSAEISKKLWYTQMIDCPDSESNLLSTCSNVLIPNSSLTVIQQKSNHHKKNLQKTCYQSLQFSQQDIMDQENIKKKSKKKSHKKSHKKINKDINEANEANETNETNETNKDYYKVGRKLPFYPSTDLKRYLNKCFGGYRFFYNKTIKFINKNYATYQAIFKERFDKGTCSFYDDEHIYCNNTLFEQLPFCELHKESKLNYNIDCNFISLRNKLLTPNKKLTAKNEWQSEIPFDLRQNAIKDAITALKSCLSNITNKNIDHFDLGYKNKRNNQICKLTNTFIDILNQQMFKSEEKNMNNKFVMRNDTLRWLKKHNNLLNDTITISRENGKYYMCCTYDVKKEKTQNQKLNTVSTS